MKLRGYNLIWILTAFFLPMVLTILVIDKLDIKASFLIIIVLYFFGFLILGYLSLIKVEVFINDSVLEFKWEKKPPLCYRNLKNIKLRAIKEVHCVENFRMIYLEIKAKPRGFLIINATGNNYRKVYTQLKEKGIPGENEKDEIEKFTRIFKKTKPNKR